MGSLAYFSLMLLFIGVMVTMRVGLRFSCIIRRIFRPELFVS